MKSNYYKLMPLLFGLLGILFGLGCYLAENSSLRSRDHFFYWAIFFIVQMAMGMVIGFLIKRLSYSAYTDGLTGLWNYRYFYDNLTQHLKQSTASCSLIYLDLDNFKCINDTNGHQCGDKVLRELVTILRENCRDTDIVARLGGDEFAIILPGTTLDIALTVAENIRKAASNQFRHYHATISAGVTISWPEARAEQLISLADQALYQAKISRNQIIPLTITDSPSACSHLK